MSVMRALAIGLLSIATTRVAEAGPAIIDEIEPNESATAAATVLAGSSGVARGWLFTKDSGDVDCFSFVAAANDRIYAAVNTAGAPSGFDDTTLRLVRPSLPDITNDNDGFFGANSSVIAGASAGAGTHYLCVERSGAANVLGYDLYWQVRSGSAPSDTESESNNTTGTADIIPGSGWVSGTLQSDVDFFTITLQAGETLFAVVDADPGRTTPFNAQIDLHSYTAIDGTTTQLDTLGGPGAAVFATAHATTAFVFSVDNGSYSANFDYHLSVTVFPDAQPAGATCVTYTTPGGPTGAFGPAAGSTIDSIINVTATGRVVDVDVDINVNHTDSDDIDIALTPPSGTAPALGIVDDFGDGNSGQVLCRIDDEAALAFGAYGVGTPLFWVDNTDSDQMNYRPKLPMRLAWLDGLPANGNWTLRVADDQASNSGNFVSWSLTVCTVPDAAFTCGAEATPATVLNASFENGNNGGFAFAAPWAIGTPQGEPIAGCAAGTGCFETNLAGNYGDNVDATLQRTIDLVGYVQPARLSWEQQYHMFAGDSLDAQIINGVTGATGPIVQRLWQWADGTMQFNVGSNVDVGFSKQVHNIDAQAGSSRLLRFNIDSDTGNSLDGWAIDNVIVEACQPTVDIVPTLTVPPSAAAGASFTATLTVNNPSTNHDIQRELVTLQLPSPDMSWAGVTYTAPSGFTCSGSPTITCSGGAGAVLAKNANSVFTFQIDVGGGASGVYGLTGSVSNSVNVDAANNTSVASTTVTGAPQANLGVSIDDGVTNIVAGGMSTYTIVVGNSGPTGVVDATVAVTFPARFSSVSWSCSPSGGAACAPSGSGSINDATVDLASGESVTYSATGTIAPTASTGPISVTATASVPGGTVDPTPGNNSQSDNDTVVQQANLTLSYTNGQTQVVGSSAQIYTLTVNNAGPSTVTGVTVTTTMPNPPFTNVTWTCAGTGGSTCGVASGTGAINSFVNVVAGQSAAYTINTTLTASPSSPVTTSATIAHAADTTPGAPNTQQDSDPVVATSTDLSVSITNGQSTIVPGNLVTYTVVAGASGATGVVNATVSTVFPGSFSNITWTCSPSGAGAACAASGTGSINDATVDLLPGTSVTYSASGTLSAGVTGSVGVTAGVAAPSGIGDTNVANNSASDVDNTMPQANLSLAYTDGATTIGAGAMRTYTLTVSNAGPSDASAVNVGATAPSGFTAVSWTCTPGGASSCGAASGTGALATTASIAANQSVVYSILATTAANATGSIATTATITSAIDTTPGNNSVTDTDTVSGTALPTTGFDLVARVTATPTTPVAGATLVYNVEITNAGPQTAVGGVVTLTLPASVTVKKLPSTCMQSGATITCTVDDLPAGGTILLAVITVVDSSAGVGIDLSATVTTNGNDNSSTNDTSSVNVTVNAVTAPTPAGGNDGGSGGTSGATGTTGNNGADVVGGQRAGCICGSSGGALDASWLFVLLFALRTKWLRRRNSDRARRLR